MTELEEMQGAIEQAIRDHVWEMNREKWTLKKLIGVEAAAQKILSLQTPTCRIAVVEKDRKLPENPHRDSNDRAVFDCGEAQQATTDDHWVREVKG
jgi:hypothetical protein